MRLRRAGADDVHMIAALHADMRRAVLAEVDPAAVTPAGDDELAVTWGRRLDPYGDWPGAVLTVDGGAGFVSYVPATDPDVPGDWHEITNLYVAGHVRGTGLGAALVRAALADMTVPGPATVLLWVFAGNASARRLYEHLGFAADGTVMAEDVVPGVPATKLRYVGQFG
jgi:GNAT superfamily N-acetyltransferase